MPKSACCQEDDEACGPFIEQERIIAELKAALRVLLDAAKNMPLKTPAPGGASTSHPYMIMAAHTWALGSAIEEAKEALQR